MESFLDQAISDQLITQLHQNIDQITTLFTEYTGSLKLAQDQTDDSLVSRLHQKILKIVQEKSEHTLYEKEERNHPQTQIKYWLAVGDNPVMLNLFALFLECYALEVRLRYDQKQEDDKYSYVGVDYEFNNRNIALMQMNFERPAFKEKKSFSYLWIINPDELETVDYDRMINLLMRNRKIMKILHGADSLDVPYMFNFMFKNDRETIRDFTARFLDTRFLCEYYLSTKGENKKCAIYEALLRFKTISEAKHKFLHETHEGMGPVQDVSWNIHKMSSFERKYALYDVIFLKHFLFDIYRMGKKETPRYYPFYKYLTRVAQFVILERRDITQITTRIKKQIDPIHNYLIRSPKLHRNLTLISIYNHSMIGLYLDQIGFYLEKLMMINYFRTQITFLMKRMLYGLVLENYQVFANKTTPYREQLPLEKLYQELEKDDYGFMVKILKGLEPILRRKVQRL